MIRSRHACVLALLLALLALAPSALAGEKKCSQNMEITDRRFSATSLVGVPVQFSDIGCAVIWRNLQCAMDQMKFDSNTKVRDYHSETEIPMSEAFFVVGAGMETPMGYDVAAFRGRADAEKFGEENNGIVVTYTELLGMKFE